jgi:hypothetical protein
MQFLNITADSTYIYHWATGLWMAESINVSNEIGTTEHSNNRCNSGTVFCGWALGIWLPFGRFPLLCLVQIQSHKSRSRIERNFRKLKKNKHKFRIVNSKIENKMYYDEKRKKWTLYGSVAAEDSHDGTLYVTALVVRTSSTAQCSVCELEACLCLSPRVGLKAHPKMGPRKRVILEHRARAISPFTLRTEAGQGCKRMWRFRDTRQCTKSIGQAIRRISWLHSMHVVISWSFWKSSASLQLT